MREKREARDWFRATVHNPDRHGIGENMYIFNRMEAIGNLTCRAEPAVFRRKILEAKAHILTHSGVRWVEPIVIQMGVDETSPAG